MPALFSHFFRFPSTPRKQRRIWALILFQCIVVPALVVLLYFNAKLLLNNHEERVTVHSNAVHTALSQHFTQSLTYFSSTAAQIENISSPKLRQQMALRYLNKQLPAKAVRLIGSDHKTLWLVSNLDKETRLPGSYLFRPSLALSTDIYPGNKKGLNTKLLGTAPSEEAFTPVCRPYTTPFNTNIVQMVECQVSIFIAPGRYGALSVLYTMQSLLSVIPAYKNRYAKHTHNDPEEQAGANTKAKTLTHLKDHRDNYRVALYSKNEFVDEERPLLFSYLVPTRLPLNLLPSTTSLYLVLYHVHYYHELGAFALGGLSLLVACLCLWFFWVRWFIKKRRKIYRHKIHAAKTRLDVLLNASVQGILVHHKQRIVYVNASFVDMFRLKNARSVIGMPLHAIFPSPEDALLEVAGSTPNGTAANQAANQAAPNQPDTDGKSLRESWGLDRQKNKVWVEGKTLPIRWDKGKALVTTLMDITHRKKSEAEALSQKRLLQTVIDNLPFLISLKDGKGMFRFINRAFRETMGSICETMGVDKQEFFSRATNNLPAIEGWPKSLQEMNAVDQQVLAKKCSIEGEWLVEIPGRKPSICHMVKIPVLDAVGEVESVVCYTQNITQRKAAETALLASEQRYRSLFEATFEGLVMLREHCILHANRPFIHMLSNPANQALDGQSILKFFSPHSQFPSLAAGDSETHYGEMELLQGNGNKLDVEVLLRAHQYNGEIVQVLAVRDISERKRMEHMIKHFVSMVSHELRTPLTSIKGALDLLTNDVAGDLPTQARKLMLIAKENCERLVRLINDILDVQRMESGNLPFANQPFELGTLLKKIGREMESYANPMQVNIDLVLPKKDCWVNADSDRIAQAIVNLVSNAVKFSNSKNTVTATLAFEEPQQRYRISVRDEGPGISTSFQERMFTPFSQEDPSDTRAKNGAGLGLSITKHIVERSGGRLTFANHPQGGANFSFTLAKLQSTASSMYQQTANANVPLPNPQVNPINKNHQPTHITRG